ncbi:hypothetical protein MM560_G66n275 [Manis javanica]|nr:hypothetical protein MM560_G66n275 [Manis javanica]
MALSRACLSAGDPGHRGAWRAAHGDLGPATLASGDGFLVARPQAAPPAPAPRQPRPSARTEGRGGGFPTRVPKGRHRPARFSPYPRRARRPRLQGPLRPRNIHELRTTKQENKPGCSLKLVNPFTCLSLPLAPSEFLHLTDPHTSGVDAARPDGGGSGGKVDKWDRMKGRLGKGDIPAQQGVLDRTDYEANFLHFRRENQPSDNCITVGYTCCLDIQILPKWPYPVVSTFVV